MPKKKIKTIKHTTTKNTKKTSSEIGAFALGSPHKSGCASTKTWSSSVKASAVDRVRIPIFNSCVRVNFFPLLYCPLGNLLPLLECPFFPSPQQPYCVINWGICASQGYLDRGWSGLGFEPKQYDCPVSKEINHIALVAGDITTSQY